MTSKPKLNQPDVETTTTFSATGESLTINMTIPTKQFKDIFVTGTSVINQQPNITFSECIKEWEQRGFEVENNDKYLSFRNTKLNIDITIDKKTQDIQICVCHYNYAKTISFDLHNLISKTIKAWEVENEKKN